MLCSVFCWETFGPAIHTDGTLTDTDLNTAADRVHPFIEAVFPDGTDLSQLGNDPCYAAKGGQEHNNQFKV